MTMRTGKLIASLLAGIALAAMALPAVWAGGKQEAATVKPADVKLTILMHPVLYNATGGKDGMITAFQKKTGYQVEVITVPLDQILEKTTVDFVSGTSSNDVFTYSDAVMHKGLAPHLLALDNYIAKSEPSYDFADFIKAAVDINRFDGKIYGIPFRYGVYMLHYRTDLFAKYGIKVPETWDDFLAAAKTITDGLRKDGITDVYGITHVAEAGLDIYETFKTDLCGYGGFIVDSAGNIRINSPEAVKALETLIAPFKNGWASPETPGMSLDQTIASFQNGKAAMYLSYSPYWGLFNDPAKSTVAGKVGWALTPHAPGVKYGRSSFSGWQMLVNTNSKFKDQAWELVRSLTTKEAMLVSAMNYANGPIRKSVLSDPKFIEKFPMARGWLDSFNASEPVLPGGSEKMSQMMDAIGREVSNALIGQKTAQQALDDAAKTVATLYKSK
jgi:multiple sugar transport system substrate-binding protein